MTNTLLIVTLAVAGGTFSYLTGIWPRRSAASSAPPKPGKMQAAARPAESKSKSSAFGRR